jgi:hypothetical protein
MYSADLKFSSTGLLYDILLEPLRKVNFKLQKNKANRWYTHTHEYVNCNVNANTAILHKLESGEPFMLSRLGTSELHTVLNYLARDKSFYDNFRDYIKGHQPEFWWGKYALSDLTVNSGFFPSNPNSLEKFSILYLEEIKKIDVLLTWLKGEIILEKSGYMNLSRTSLQIFDCEPYFYSNPWTLGLRNKKVLVIHPFEESIKFQYRKRDLLFSNNTLPEFELKTIKAIQSVRGNSTNFSSWFDALDYLKNEIDKVDFDVALIAAGAYGLPLAAHVKEIGKIGLHLGGFLQMIFGIRGKRWDLNEAHCKIMNHNWKHPFKDEYPINYDKLDHGCYW